MDDAVAAWAVGRGRAIAIIAAITPILDSFMTNLLGAGGEVGHHWYRPSARGWPVVWAVWCSSPKARMGALMHVAAEMAVEKC
ncbi:hypothetical protein GCM10027200_49470 [Lentzea nigeriaca]